MLSQYKHIKFEELMWKTIRLFSTYRFCKSNIAHIILISFWNGGCIAGFSVFHIAYLYAISYYTNNVVFNKFNSLVVLQKRIFKWLH